MIVVTHQAAKWFLATEILKAVFVGRMSVESCHLQSDPIVWRPKSKLRRD